MCCVILSRFARTATFRLALVYAVIFGISSLLLFGFLYWRISVYGLEQLRGAIDLGFSRAFSAILDGQLTTAAAGWVLLQYGSGPIKGFAVMLLVGVFTTLFVNIWCTRIFFDWAVARKKGTASTLSI
jgi:preprotein translocase subunit SecF